MDNKQQQQLPFLQINDQFPSAFIDYQINNHGGEASPSGGQFPPSPVMLVRPQSIISPNTRVQQQNKCLSPHNTLLTEAPLSPGIGLDALQLQDDLLFTTTTASSYQNNMLSYPENSGYSVGGSNSPTFPTSPYQDMMSFSSLENSFTQPAQPVFAPVNNASPGSDTGMDSNFLFVDTFQQSRRRSTSDVTNNNTLSLQLPFLNTAPPLLTRAGSFDGLASAGGLLSPIDGLATKMLSPGLGVGSYESLFYSATPTSPLPTSNYGMNMNFQYDFSGTETDRRLSDYQSGGMAGGLSVPEATGPLRRKSSGGRTRSVSPNPESEAQHVCPVPECGKTFNRRGNMMAHFKTHDPNRERNFECDVCLKSFCRPHGTHTVSLIL